MSAKGKEYELAIRIAGIVDKSFSTSIGTAERTLNKTVANLDKDFTKLDKGFDGIMALGSKAFQAVATAASVAATAIGAATAAAVNVGMDFEKQMSTVQAISGASGSELEALTDTARKLAQTSVFSATEVGQAMEYMGMAGWETEQILAGIEGVLSLAAASGEELASVSDIVTDDLTAFHMEAEEAARMVDVMAQAAMNSNTNVAMMGETFKYAGTVAGAMGYQIEDIAIATGLMASSGIKASEAGTALRSIINRMAKPTKESAEAMEALGLTLERNDGSMYSFLEIMEQMREGMDGMTETQKAYYAAELAGKTGMSAMLAIANSTDRQFEELTEAIYHAEGAAQRMADIRMDNLAGDVQIFQDALADAGIELYQELNGPLRSLTQMGTGFINNAATQIPKAVNKISSEFPALQRKFKKFAQPVFSGILDGGKWIIKHGQGIISVLAGVGAALAAYKAVSSIVHIVNAVMSLGSLNPATLGILGVVSAIGLLTGAVAAYKQHEKELVNQSLASHFGNISLSMGEIQRIAEEIVRTDSLAGVREALSAFDDADGILNNLQAYIDELNLMNWKVSVGLELTEEEQDSYKTAVEGYISEIQKYALQERYAVSLNLSVSLSGENSGIISKVDRFYEESYAEMQRLGNDLSKAVTEAFADGVLDPEEADYIAELQKNLADVKSALATGDFEAGLIKIQMEYGSGAALDSESFQNVQAELSEQTEKIKDEYLESYSRTVAALNNVWKNGGFDSYSEYQDAMTDAQLTYYTNVSGALNSAAQFQIDALEDAFGGDISTAFDKVLQSYTENGIRDWLDRPGALFAGMQDSLSKDEEFKYIRKSILQRLEEMQGTIEAMEEMKSNYDAMSSSGAKLSEADRASYETISELLSQFSMMKGIADLDMGDGYWKALGEQIAKGDYSEFYKEVFAGLEEKEGEYENYGWEPYIYVPQGLYDGIDGAANEAAARIEESIICPAVEGMYAWSQEAIDEYFAQDFQATADVAITFNPYWRQKETVFSSPAMLDGLLKGVGGLDIDQNADGGIIRNKELSWLAERGPEAVIPLDGSRNAVSLWEKAGQFMGMDSRFDGLDLGGGEMVKIEFNPTYQFYGEAPSKQDMVDAASISQDDFNRMMNRYLKEHSRVSFG